eukprot:GDKI01028379.1.p1 GENE.GDKI01028379.1~~GDKI01028379.1.p1  ORF type:complete len:283 (-),score=68.91 GDKI01028379.1:870-1718(-)
MATAAPYQPLPADPVIRPAPGKIAALVEAFTADPQETFLNAVYLAVFAFIYYWVTLFGCFIPPVAMVITFTMWRLFSVTFTDVSSVTLPVTTLVVLYTFGMTFLNLLLEYIISELMQLDLDGNRTKHTLMHFIPKYIVMGVVVGVLDALALFFVCRTIASSAPPEAMPYYGMLAANIIAHLTFVIRDLSLNALGDLPPFLHKYLGSSTFMGYAYVSIPILMLMGYLCGKGLTHSGNARIVASLVIPMVIRIVANLAVFAYEWLLHWPHADNNDHMLKGGFLQ